MPEGEKKSFAAIFVVGFLIILGIIGLAYFIHVRFLSGPAPLPADTFSSRLEERRYWDEKLQKEIIYWVIATSNQSSDTFYNCRFDLVARGTQDVYEGFFKDYVLQNCHQYDYVKDNYDCRLENAWKKYTRYSPARTLRKFPSHASSELPVSRFYFDNETRSDQSFLTKNQLSDTQFYLITCRTSSGRPVSHTQLF